MKLLKISLFDGLKDLWIELKLDVHYMFFDFWKHDYGIHFLLGLLFQTFLVLSSGMYHWFDWYNAILLFSVLQLIFWTAKEVMAYCQEKWTFGLIPNSDADYRDMRFSMYGVMAVNIIYTIAAIIAY